MYFDIILHNTQTLYIVTFKGLIPNIGDIKESLALLRQTLLVSMKAQKMLVVGYSFHFILHASRHMRRPGAD